MCCLSPFCDSTDDTINNYSFEGFEMTTSAMRSFLVGTSLLSTCLATYTSTLALVSLSVSPIRVPMTVTVSKDIFSLTVSA